ncbi:hypothetical protein HYH03_015032 [Edaphochlamys debaryana]|uniref:Uncharacterized protein n=1 Tax=Edaphochlamys debaryana TaxID=47281 RepID=A0A836BT05_9CHLO|nr:hypothetical protein HYH03_015032 [Edaphochlamys debaryana]|eukprot:KAG2486328.1 hypothetical protein HYH03_015032 [Edaphochlamys debaryana]
MQVKSLWYGKLRAKSFRRRSLLGLYVRNLAAMKEGAAESAAARNEAYTLALQEHSATDAAIAQAVGGAAEGGDDGGEASGSGDGNGSDASGSGRGLLPGAIGGGGCRSAAGSLGFELGADYDGNLQQPTGGRRRAPRRDLAPHMGQSQASRLPMPSLQLQLPPMSQAQPLALQPLQEQLQMQLPPLGGGDFAPAASGLAAPSLAWDGGVAAAGMAAAGGFGAAPAAAGLGGFAAALGFDGGSGAWGSAGGAEPSTAAALAAAGGSAGGGGWTGELLASLQHGLQGARGGGSPALHAAQRYGDGSAGLQTDSLSRPPPAAAWEGRLDLDARSLNRAWPHPHAHSQPPRPTGVWPSGSATAGLERAMALAAGPLGTGPHSRSRSGHRSLASHTAAQSDAWQQAAAQQQQQLGFSSLHEQMHLLDGPSHLHADTSLDGPVLRLPSSDCLAAGGWQQPGGMVSAADPGWGDLGLTPLQAPQPPHPLSHPPSHAPSRLPPRLQGVAAKVEGGAHGQAQAQAQGGGRSGLLGAGGVGTWPASGFAGSAAAQLNGSAAAARLAAPSDSDAVVAEARPAAQSDRRLAPGEPAGFPAAMRNWGLRELCFPETWMPAPAPHWRYTAPAVPSKELGAGIAAAVEEFEGPPGAVQELIECTFLPPAPQLGLPTMLRHLNGKPSFEVAAH